MTRPMTQRSTPTRYPAPVRGLLGAALFALACGPPPAPPPTPPEIPPPPPLPTPWTGPGAILEGRVVFRGPDPSLRPLPVVSQTDLCGVRPKPNESLVIGPDQGLAHLVVMFPRARPLPDTPPPPPPVLDQRACVFVPHLAAVAEGDPFRLRNSDPTLHNVHALSDPGGYDRFNVGMPAGGADHELVAKRSEALRIRCDAGHRWMRAILYVTPTRLFAVSDLQGRFRIPGIPEGTHAIEFWHETLGRTTGKLTFRSDRTTRVDLSARLDPEPALVLAPSTEPTPIATAP